MFRRIWLPGVRYQGETDAQAAQREADLRELDRLCDAMEAAQNAARARPMPHLETWAQDQKLWNPETNQRHENLRQG